MSIILIALALGSFINSAVLQPMTMVSASQNQFFLSPEQSHQKQQIKQIWVTITAYSSEPEQTDSTPFTTAFGTQVHDGVVAANFLGFGTKVRIPELFGNKNFVVEDRLNSRFSDRIDIWMPDTEQAIHFGRQRALVEVEI